MLMRIIAQALKKPLISTLLWDNRKKSVKVFDKAFRDSNH